MIKTIDDIFSLARQKGHGCRLVLCQASNEHALEAALEASAMGFVTPILVGRRDEIHEAARNLGRSVEGVQIVEAEDAEGMVEAAVRMVSSGQADILMKGGVTTPQIMKGVLNRQWGLRTDRLISHLAVFQIPAYHKLLVLTDAAMNIAPTLEEKAVIVQNTVDFVRRLGIDTPKVAVLAAIEQVNPKMPATLDADALKQMNARGEIVDCLVDGPLVLRPGGLAGEQTRQAFRKSRSGRCRHPARSRYRGGQPPLQVLCLLYRRPHGSGHPRGGSTHRAHFACRYDGCQTGLDRFGGSRLAALTSEGEERSRARGLQEESEGKKDPDKEAAKEKFE